MCQVWWKKRDAWSYLAWSRDITPWSVTLETLVFKPCLPDTIRVECALSLHGLHLHGIFFSLIYYKSALFWANFTAFCQCFKVIFCFFLKFEAFINNSEANTVYLYGLFVYARQSYILNLGGFIPGRVVFSTFDGLCIEVGIFIWQSSLRQSGPNIPRSENVK